MKSDMDRLLALRRIVNKWSDDSCGIFVCTAIVIFIVSIGVTLITVSRFDSDMEFIGKIVLCILFNCILWGAVDQHLSPIIALRNDINMVADFTQLDPDPVNPETVNRLVARYRLMYFGVQHKADENKA